MVLSVTILFDCVILITVICSGKNNETYLAQSITVLNNVTWTTDNSEGGYGINIQVEKSKNMTIVKLMECDLNQLFRIFVDS